MRGRHLLLGLPAMLAAGPTAAWAQPEVSANVGVVTDYRYRGVSLSDRDPALQGGVDVEFESGWSFGTWASTIDEGPGEGVEVDIYGGYSTSVAGFDLSITGLAYLYPASEFTDYVEVTGSVGHTIGPVTAELQIAYAPEVFDNPVDNLYLGAQIEVAVPTTPLTLRLRGGYEDGFYDSKWDWEAGLSYTRGFFTVSASYVDTDSGDVLGRIAEGGFVGTLQATF